MTQHRGALLVILAAALFGTVGTARVLGPDAPSLQVAAARMGLAALVFAAVALAASGRNGWDGLWRRPATWIAGVAQASFQWSFLEAVTSVGVATGTLIAIGLMPLITGAISLTVSRVWFVATGLGLVGLYLLVGAGDRPDPAGVAAAVLAATSYAVYVVASSSLARSAARLEPTLAVIFTISAAVLLPAALFGEWGWLATGPGLLMVAYLAIVPSVLAYRALNTGLATVPAATAATLGLTEPVVASVLGIVVLDENLGPDGILGAVLVLGSVLLLVRAHAARGDTAAAVGGQSRQ